MILLKFIKHEKKYMIVYQEIENVLQKRCHIPRYNRPWTVDSLYERDRLMNYFELKFYVLCQHNLYFITVNQIFWQKVLLDKFHYVNTELIVNMSSYSFFFFFAHQSKEFITLCKIKAIKCYETNSMKSKS